jgi:SNF2 family DNA or RNA helicase
MSSSDLDAPSKNRGDATGAVRGRGERISFEDEEPARKKRTQNTTSPVHHLTTTTTKTTSSLVGRRKPRRVKTKTNFPDEEDDEENDLLEHTLPGYLRERRRERDEQQEKGLEGLSLPPVYDDIAAMGVAPPGAEEKPKLPGVSPPRPYAPIHLSSGSTIPAPLAQYLKPYQVEGTEWLHRKFIHQQGAILGDDMGLGKTIQVIAFLTAAYGKTGDVRDEKRMRAVKRHDETMWYPRVLIVCPGTLMENWKCELDRWGWWQLYMYHGNAAAKEAALAAADKGRLEIMITTYDTYKRDEGYINMVPWDCVIADEVHGIKERKSQNAKAMNNVNALCRIGLSGTAIQNKYEELWTLLNWANPGSVGSIATWKRCICIPLKIGQSHDASVSQLAKARRTALKVRDHLLPRFFLRRTKALIAHQLPKKSDRVVFCPLTETQVEAYQNFTDSELVHAIRDSGNPCYCGSGKKQGWCCMQKIEDFGDWRLHVFPALVTVQKLSNHVALMVPSGEADPERHDKDLQKLKICLPDAWEELYRNRDSIKNLSNAEFCGKWKVLRKLLKLWHDNGDKVLIFSHSVRLLRMLELLLKFHTSYNVSYLDGSMTYADRQASVDEFNADGRQFAFLISTKAGGVGLNITSANKVVVMDPNWNPAYDLQAQDRAYRIGQTRDVEVFRLVSVGTVEEIVYARQIYKQQQANIGYNASVERRYFKGVQDQKDQKGEIFGLTNLFAPQKANVVLKDIVNQTNIAETRAGVEIAGLDLEASQEDDDALPFENKEDAAISQLAAEILDEPGRRRKLAQQTAKKRDPVQAILASAGVEYTHENAEVVGTSKIETKISSRAQKAGNDVDFINELAFARGTQSRPQVAPSHERTDRGGLTDGDGEGMDVADGLGKVHYKYRPPEDVRRRQFCSMAKQFGYEDVVEFAMVVEGWTQEQRRNFLERFYEGRRSVLAQGG